MPVCTGLTLQAMVTPLQLGHVTRVHNVYLPFYKLYNNYTWENGKQKFTEITLQVMVTLSQV